MLLCFPVYDSFFCLSIRVWGQGVDLIPSNIELAGMEVGLVNAMSREKILKQVLDVNKRSYDFILLDCTPSLGMLTINSLAAADSALGCI